MQLGLDLPYPPLSLAPRGPFQRWRVGIHRRPPGLPASSLPTCWLPSPCRRLSRPPTTTKPPPHPTVINRRRACPPLPWPGSREGDPGWFPRSPRTDRRGRCPAIPRPPRHEYAAAFPRGLLTGLSIPAPESPATSGRADAHGTPTQIHQVRVGSTLTGLHALVPLVHLLVSLAGPAPSGSADAPRRCQDCFPPSPASPGSGCPQLQPDCCDSPAVRAFHPYSVTLAPRGARTGRRTCGRDRPPPNGEVWPASPIPADAARSARPRLGAAIHRRVFRHYSLHPFSKPLPPFPMCTGFPRLGVLRRLRPVPTRSADDGPSPTATLETWQPGRTGTVPAFTVIRSTKEEPSSVPAASPRLPRSTSPWPPGTDTHMPAREFPARPRRHGCAPRPAHIRQI